jgi:sigma-B regulation protein RsbU (phosphoserine phosphatase)
MMTMFVRQTVRTLAEEGCSPPLVLQGLLEKFLGLGLDDEVFITVLYGIYNPEDSVFAYSNAGHNPPIVFKRDGAAVVEGASLPICSLARGCGYREYKLHLEKGDSLYLYTDGITEARNKAGAFFGVDGIIRALEQGKGVEGVIESVKQFSGGRLLDDIAILGAKVL